MKEDKRHVRHKLLLLAIVGCTAVVSATFVSHWLWKEYTLYTLAASALIILGIWPSFDRSPAIQVTALSLVAGVLVGGLLAAKSAI
jgi:hypothetical protein